jgi:hypothetical protein
MRRAGLKNDKMWAVNTRRQMSHDMKCLRALSGDGGGTLAARRG